jgi:alkylation response protein AidB-like acyl-CoA dehydrogenase
MDFSLTPEQKELQSVARAFAQKEMTSVAKELEEKKEFLPDEWFD